MFTRTLKLAPAALAIALALGGCGLLAPSSAPPPDSGDPPESTPVETPVQTGGVMLYPEGIGTFHFGASEEDVVDFLASELGNYEAEGGPGWCGEAAGSYQMYYYFGEELKVRFSSEYDSPDTPRYLASWEYISENPPAPPLILSAQIPWGLTLDELMAEYPDGDGWEGMGAWVAGDVAIMPPSAEASATVLHAGQFDWCG